MTQAVLADACGWSSQGTVSQYLNGRLELNGSALSRFAIALQFDPMEVSPRLTEFYRQAISNAGQLRAIPIEVDPNAETYVVELRPPMRKIAIKGTAQLGPDGYWYALDHDDGHIVAPSSDPDAYALRLRGESMAPAIRSGWIALCEPNHRLIPGEYVMLKLHDEECMVKELLYCNDQEYSVMSINSAFGRRSIPTHEVVHAHYVGGIFPPSKAIP
ncbi:LexA family transcriptional regulator [Pseudomonas oryzihabitans]|uniref:LexA family transcriptional regulator n=1 Tax=Pseudomonas oryzihabitans TaxID=47885 RepID=UPI00289E9C3F|nr:S24 family peptidase [Pseudomonas oryzihabitans]